MCKQIATEVKNFGKDIMANHMMSDEYYLFKTKRQNLR